MSDPLGPLSDRSATGRLAALDVARGFALLGILVVNVEYFALPLGQVSAVEPPSGWGLDTGLWWLERVFCEGKLYPLFSLLFGMGMVLQRRRAFASGREYGPLALRRLGALCLLGLVHGLLLWHGDILLSYGVAGLLALPLAATSWRRKLGVAVVLWLIAAGVSALNELGLPTEAAGAELGAAVETGRSEGLRPRQVLAERWAAGGDPLDARWQQAEIEAHRHGPWLDLEAFRAASFGLVSLSMVLGGGPHVLAMFLLGAALMELGAFEAELRRQRTRVAVLGLIGGTLLAALATALVAVDQGPLARAGWQLLLMLGGPLLSLGYLAGWALAVEPPLSARVRWLTAPLGAAGRMALTNYLLQTLAMTFVMDYWGLGLFAAVSRPERWALVLAVFAAQLVLSPIWLRAFAYGPAEWLWRCVTYGRRLPLRRA